MKGMLDPVVLFPRYTTLIEAGTFATVGLNVEPYDKATITVWRGYAPSGGSCTVFLEDSHDGVVWTSLNGAGEDPGANAATIIRVDLRRRWLRAKVVLTTDGITCWAAGALERRVDGGFGTGA